MLGLGMLPSLAYKESAGMVKGLPGRYLEPGRLHVSQCFLYQGVCWEQEDLHLEGLGVQEPEKADSGCSL